MGILTFRGARQLIRIAYILIIYIKTFISIGKLKYFSKPGCYSAAPDDKIFRKLSQDYG